MVRKAQKVILNPYVAPILFELTNITEGFNSNELSKILNKSQRTIYDHLQNLEKEGFIESIDSKRGAYKLNLDRIIEEFYNLLISFIKSREDLDFLHKNKKLILNNEYLKNIFLITFKNFKGSNLTILEVFMKIIEVFQSRYFEIIEIDRNKIPNGLKEVILNSIINNLKVSEKEAFDIFIKKKQQDKELELIFKIEDILTNVKSRKVISSVSFALEKTFEEKYYKK